VVYPDNTIEAEGLCAVSDVDGDVLTYGFRARAAPENSRVRARSAGSIR